MSTIVEQSAIDRDTALLRLVPDLWTGDNRSVIYIGASKDRCDYLDQFHASGWRVQLVEAFAANVAAVIKGRSWLERIYCMDIRDGCPCFADAVFWWHGPEHVHATELDAVLFDLEMHAEQLVILGAPWGMVEQGEIDGNPYERHVAAIEQGTLEAFGYACEYHGVRGVCGSSVIAAKVLL